MVTASKRFNEDEEYLLLTGNDAKTVHIFSVVDTTGQSARFASSANGPFYSEGFGWQYAGAPDPLQVSFVFHGNVSGLTCPDLSYTATTTSQSPLSITAATNEFKFNVQFTNSPEQDPVIIVKPVDD